MNEEKVFGRKQEIEIHLLENLFGKEEEKAIDQSMSTSFQCNFYEKEDEKHLLDNYVYLNDHRCLKQRPNHPPLALRRSVSLEDSSTDPEKINQIKEQSTTHLLPSLNPQLSSSLNSLCLRLRRYQLLPEFNEDIAKTADQNDFNWWKTAVRLRPIFERVIMAEYRRIITYPETYLDDEQISFHRCLRQGRRNAVCLGIDRLCYNDQLILFATIANEVQLEFNLLSSGFKV